MKVIYIFRAPSKERSIERVFNPVMQYMSLHNYKVEANFANSCRLWPIAMVYNMFKYAILSYCHRKYVYHITGDVQYVACLMNNKNTVMTIHDCVTLHNKNVPRWFKWLVSKLWYEIPLRHLHKITCISEATRQDLLQLFPWVEDKLTVVPNPVGTEFYFSPKIYNKECPVILHVGTRSNKNLERVIESLEGIRCKLLIIGKLSTEQLLLLQKYKINFENCFNISDNEIVTAYNEADIVSFPSLFEGFGMPIIEGQTVGRPVVTSDLEPMRSVAGKGAVLVDPQSEMAIRNGFLKLLKDEKYYENVVNYGRQNAAKYAIDSVANSYLLVYKHIKNTKK